MSEKQFVDGLRVYKPNPKAPDFIIANVVITRKDLGNWLRANTDEEIRVDIKESKKGSYYAEVNDYRPQAAEAATEIDSLDDLPF